MRCTPLVRLSVLGLALTAAACSDATGPSRQEPGVESAFAEIAGIVTLASQNVPMAIAALSAAPGTCAFVTAAQRFECAPVTVSHLTFTRSYQLLSASGDAQSAFDRATTAAVRTSSTTSGTIEGGDGPVALDGTSTITLSGLLAGRHVLDGSDVMRMSGGGFSATFATTYAGVVLPSAPAELYPQAGTVTTAITFPPSVAADQTIEVRFNGTSLANLTFTSAGITQRCTWNLAARVGNPLTCSA